MVCINYKSKAQQALQKAVDLNDSSFECLNQLLIEKIGEDWSLQLEGLTTEEAAAAFKKLIKENLLSEYTDSHNKDIAEDALEHKDQFTIDDFKAIGLNVVELSDYNNNKIYYIGTPTLSTADSNTSEKQEQKDLSKRAVEKNPKIRVVPITVTENKNRPESYDKQTNPFTISKVEQEEEEDHFVLGKVRAGTNINYEKNIVAALDSALINNTLKVGSYISVYTDELSEEDTIKMLKSLKNIRKYYPLYIAEYRAFPDAMSEETKEKIKKIGYLGIPTFTLCKTKQDINLLKSERELYNTQLASIKNLKSLANITASEFIRNLERLKTDENAKIEFFGKDKFKDVNFIGMSNQQIFSIIGTDEILNALAYRPVILNPDSEIANNRKLRFFIRKNFKAFIMLASDVLLGNGSLVIKRNGNILINEEEEDFKIEDENGNVTNYSDPNIGESIGSALEGWEIVNTEVNPITSISKQVKLKLSTLVDTSTVKDKNGQLKPKTPLNELGFANILNTEKSIALIYEWTLGAESLDDKDENGNYKKTSMVQMLRNHMGEAGWLCQLVGDYFPYGVTDRVVPSGDGEYKVVDIAPEKGLLIDGKQENEQFRSLFFTNFSKTFQTYLYLSEDKGNVLLKELNKSAYAEDFKDRYILLLDALSFPRLKDDNGKFKKDLLENLINSIEKVGIDNIENLLEGKKNLSGLSREDLIKNVNNILYHLGLEKIDKKVYKNNKDDILNELVIPLQRILDGIYRKIDVQNPQPLSQSHRGYINRLLEFLSRVTGNVYVPNAHVGTKRHYSYILSSKLNRLVTELKNNDFSEYDYDGWFVKERNHDGSVKSYFNYWLQVLKRDPANREVFDHAVLLSDRKVDYAEKKEHQLLSSILHCFFYAPTSNRAWFRVTVLSNKPSEEYIKFFKLENKELKDAILNVFYQEVNRIAAVKERKKTLKNKKENEISAFDKHGDRFHFLKMLNNKQLLVNDSDKIIDLREDLDAYLKGELSDTRNFTRNISKYIMQELTTQAEKWLTSIEEDGFLSIDKDTGEVKKCVDNSLISKLDAVLNHKGNRPYRWGYDHKGILINFYLNDYFAQINMVQLMVGDIAMYKNAEEFNKRIAEVHASTFKPHKGATFEGNRVSDGYYRAVIIKDPINVKSDVIEAIDKALESKQLYGQKEDEDLKKSIISILQDLKKAFSNIDWTDGQGLTCPSAYRKRMILFGKWTKEDEEAYKALTSDVENIDLNAIKVLWQPLKSFVYSLIPVNGYNQAMPVIPKGLQIKYSEYCIVLAGAMLKKLGVKSQLGVLYDIMEDSYKEHSLSGLDAVVYESAVKVGIQNVIPDTDLNTLEKNIKDRIYKEDGTYNNDYVQTIDFTDCGIQQEVPGHWNDHTDKQYKTEMGSQLRVIPITNVPNGAYVTDSKGKSVYKDHKIQIRESLGSDNVVSTITVKEGKSDYLGLLAKKIDRSIQKLQKRFYLYKSENNPNIGIIRDAALSNELISTIAADDNKADLLEACSLDENGHFNIPLSDPIQTTRVQQVINSLLSKKIWGQEFVGGMLVQASSRGLSEDLRVVTNPDGTIAYAEAYVSVYDDELLRFKKEDGTIDIEAIEKKNPKLLDMLGYRIPTESVYSTIPIKIKGFIVGGDAIMLPKEITKYAGSDFDIDKLKIIRYAYRKEWSEETLKEAENYIFYNDNHNVVTIGQIRDYLDGNTSIENLGISEESEDKIKKYLDSLTPEFLNPKEGTEEYDDNKILDYLFAFLYSPLNLKRFTTPGGFETLKKSAYYIGALKALAKDASLKERLIGEHPEYFEKTEYEVSDSEKIAQQMLREDLSVDTLKDIIFNNVDILDIASHLNFHRKNMTAAKTIGVFASNLVAYGFCSIDFESTTLLSNKNISCNICGTRLESIGKVDQNNVIYYAYETAPMYESREVLDGNTVTSVINKNKYVSENIAEGVGASADAVKFPLFDYVGVNMDTINSYMACIWTGVSLHNANLFIGQPAIEKLCKEYSINGSQVDFTQFLNTYILKLAGNLSGLKGNKRINTWIKNTFEDKEEGRTVSSIELKQRLAKQNENGNEGFDLNILLLFRKVLTFGKMLRDITGITKLNSKKNGLGPNIIDNLDTQDTIDNFELKYKGAEFNGNPITTYDKLLGNPLLSTFAKKPLVLARDVFGNNFLESSDAFLRLFRLLKARLGGTTKQDLFHFIHFVKDYYMLKANNGANQIFDTSATHRRHVLYDYPKIIENFVKTNPRYADNDLIRSIRFAPSRNKEFTEMFINTKQLPSYRIKELKAAFEKLYFNDFKLAWSLIEYSFNMSGFKPTYRGFMKLMPDVMKKGIMAGDEKGEIYHDKTATLDVAILESDADNIINQFMITRGYADRMHNKNFLKTYNNSEEVLSALAEDADPNTIVKYKDCCVYYDFDSIPHVIDIPSSDICEVQPVPITDVKTIIKETSNIDDNAIQEEGIVGASEEQDYSMPFIIASDEFGDPLFDTLENVTNYLIEGELDNNTKNILRRTKENSEEVQKLAISNGLSIDVINNIINQLKKTDTDSIDIVKAGNKKREKDNLCS